MELLALLIFIGAIAYVLILKLKAKSYETRGDLDNRPEHEDFEVKDDKAKKQYSYEKLDVLFSPAERSFYGVLAKAVGDKAVIFGKVRVADVLKPEKGLSRSDWRKAFNQISAKHFDYVICRPSDLKIIATVELDDKSHDSKKRIARDEFLESACKTANIKLHRFKAKSSYSINEIRQQLSPPKNDDKYRRPKNLKEEIK